MSGASELRFEPGTRQGFCESGIVVGGTLLDKSGVCGPGVTPGNPAVEQARVQMAGISDLEMLRDMLVKIALLQKPEEVVPLLGQLAPARSEQALERQASARSAPVRKRAAGTRRPRKKAE